MKTSTRCSNARWIDFDDVGEAAAASGRIRTRDAGRSSASGSIWKIAPRPARPRADLRVAEIRRRGARAAGEPWRDRLLRLPAVLARRRWRPNGWSDQDLQDGFRATGLFLLRHVLEPRGQGHSDARDGFINAVPRTAGRAR